MVHAGCVFVAGVHQSRTWMSGSFESFRWNACVHRIDLGLYSHPKEFWGNGVRIHVNSKGTSPLSGKFSSEEDRTHDAASSSTASPAHYQTSYSGPLNEVQGAFLLTCVKCWPGRFIRLFHKSNGVLLSSVPFRNRLVGLVIKASMSTAADLDSIAACSLGLFSKPSHANDLKLGTPMTTLPGAWCYWVSAGTGLPGVCIL